jgi:GAF domain-containing protein
VGDRAVHTSEAHRAQLAVENERLQRALRARLKEEEALRRVATLVAREHAPGEVLALVTEEVGRHLEADTAVTVRYDAPGRATFVATWTAPHVDPSPFRVGRQFEPVPRGALARALETVAPVRVDSYEGLPGSFAREVRATGIRATVAAPILVDGQLWGAFAAGSRTGPLDADAEARLGAFAELVAQAIANVDARIKLKESRARIVEAADDARRRIERDLHDGAQQRLVALALSLQLVARSA